MDIIGRTLNNIISKKKSFSVRNGGKTPGIKLVNPLNYKFGSVNWQDAMLHNIREKRQVGEEYGPMERTFANVQHQHNVRNKLYKKSGGKTTDTAYLTKDGYMTGNLDAALKKGIKAKRTFTWDGSKWQLTDEQGRWSGGYVPQRKGDRVLFYNQGQYKVGTVTGIYDTSNKVKVKISPKKEKVFKSADVTKLRRR